MRIAVIGAGRMGTIRAEDLAADGRVDDIVILNRNAERAAALAAGVGGTSLPWPEDPGDSTQWPEADGYAVTTATDAHAELIAALAEHRRPLLIEKPLAMSLEETDALVAMAGKTGMQIGFQRRFDAGIRGVKERIDSGELGVLYSLTFTAHDIAPGTAEFIAGSGGTFKDMLVHDLDLARWLSDSEIATVYATGTVRHHADYAAADDYDVVAVHLTMASGVPILISGTRHDPVGHDIRLEAFGSEDSVTAGLNHRTPIHPADGDLPTAADPYRGFMDRFRAAFTAETSAFVDFVLGIRENPCPPEASRAALAAAIACEISAREGRPVAMSEVE